MGVTYRKERGTWRALIQYYGKHIYIGTYKTALLAAQARDRYVIENRLFEYKLNFPELCQLSLKLD